MADGGDYSMTRVLAAWVEVCATIVMFIAVWKLRDTMMMALPILTWWASVSAGVLALYGTKSITDRKLNKGGAG